MVETGKKFLSHTKALHTTEETSACVMKDGIFCDDDKDYNNSWVRTAAKMDAHSQEPWTTLHFRIRELDRKPRASSRRAQAQAEECSFSRQPNRVRRPRSTDFAYCWQGTGEE